MATRGRDAENSFTLNYNQQTNVCLLRQGFVKEPIPRDLRSRCMKLTEWETTQTRIYNEGNGARCREILRPIDYLLDDNGLILTESSGNWMSSYAIFPDPLVVSFGKKFFCAKHLIRLNCLSAFFKVVTETSHFLLHSLPVVSVPWKKSFASFS